uniref:Uncharacterized protein n=1 Tax=Marmota marmota marmota TaxID=9994 RepID=A0A8C5ZVR9_MARMA
MGWRTGWQPVLHRTRNYRRKSRSWRDITSPWWLSSVSSRRSLLKPQTKLPRQALAFWYHQSVSLPSPPASIICLPAHFHPDTPHSPATSVFPTQKTPAALCSLPSLSPQPKCLAFFQILLFSLVLIILPSFSPFQGLPEAGPEDYQPRGVISRNILTHVDMTESRETPVEESKMGESLRAQIANTSTRTLIEKRVVETGSGGHVRTVLHADEM